MDSDEPYRHGQPRLNFDILHLVCNHLSDVSDVLSFALTCSTLMSPAFQRRLKMSQINLWDKESVDSFHRFIFADEAARAPYIYGLKLPDPHYYGFGTSDPQFQVINDHLVAILRAAVHLEYIYFPTTVDLDPEFAAAANMTSLRELSIILDSNSPWKLLSTFQSPLRSLRIDDGDMYDGVTARSLHDHLAKFTPTLEALELDFIHVDLSPSFVTTQFTAVRSLTIHSIHNFDQFTVELLLRFFPNLNDTLILGRFEATHTEDVYPHWRELNKEAQKDRAWPRLDRVDCDAQLAFLMALRCPIRRMDLKVARNHATRYLVPTLRLNYPRQLHVRIPFADGSGNSDELFPSTEGAANLTHLVLFADFQIHYGPREKRNAVPWNLFRDKLIGAIKHLRLTHLRLVFHCDVFQDGPERKSVYTAGEMDLLPAAIEFVRAIPTLRYILLTTCRQSYKVNLPLSARMPVSVGFQSVPVSKWLSSKAWQIVSDHNGDRHSEPGPSDVDVDASFMELSASEVGKIMDREELHLSHDEENTLREYSDFHTAGGN